MKTALRTLALVLAFTALLPMLGCATLLFPERAGIDWGIFMSDVFLTAGLGLALDFIHGTIRLAKSAYHGPGYDRGLFAPKHEPLKSPDP